MTVIHGWATHAPRQGLEPFTNDGWPLDPEQVEIAVKYCGICYSDVAMINDEWGWSQYPFIPGHEVVGHIVALGNYTKGLQIGQRLGINGMGHMALKFARAWGCEVTAFTSQQSKAEEVCGFGANHVVLSFDSEGWEKIASSLDMLIMTDNAPQDWKTLLKTLKPKGRLHILGVMTEPIPIMALDLILGHNSVSGSLVGSPTMIATMLEFAARTSITPKVEHFLMCQANEALARLCAGKVRYRIVLDADFD